ncbi:MAG: homoserine kinase, partial [Endomicrobiales bacterium]
HLPLVSGLGSSAAARLGGILAANEIAGKRLSEEEILSLGVEMEGHPDNLVPALAGGLCACVTAGKKVSFIKLPAPKLKAAVCTPDFALATESARKVLPTHLPLSSVVFNCSRLALLMAALQTGRYGHLAEAMEDCLHQPSRERLVPGMAGVLEAARTAGAYGAALSGAGPSVIALCSPSRARRVALSMKNKWLQGDIGSRSFILDFDPRGARTSVISGK